MALTAVTKNGVVIYSPELTDANREKDFYFCRNCHTEMRLRIPKKKITHFAHLPSNGCGLAGESISHMEAKKYFFDLYRNDVKYRTVEMERRLWNDDRIGDVVLYPKNVELPPTVIEIQNSPISINELKTRIYDWNESGYYMLWVLTDNVIHPQNDVRKERVVPKWVRYLHGVYMGRVYVYSDDSIYAIHLDSVSRYNDYTGYEYFLKTVKTVDSRIVDGKNLLQTMSNHAIMDRKYMITRFYDKKFWG